MNDCFVTCNVANGQQGEQHGQAQEHELQHARGFQRTEEHEQSEHAPQTQVSAQELTIGCIREAHFRHQQNRNQRQPERTVGGKGG